MSVIYYYLFITWKAELAFILSNVLGTFFTLAGLLRQKHTDKHFLPCLRIHICLECEQRLSLILRQPQSLELQRSKRHGQISQPIENTRQHADSERELLKQRTLYRYSHEPMCVYILRTEEEKGKLLFLIIRKELVREAI